MEAYGRLYLGGVEQGLGCLCAALAIEGDALPERLRHDIAAFFDGSPRLAGDDPARRARPTAACAAARDPAALARYVIATLEGALLMERLFASPAAFRGTLAVLVDGLRPR